MASPDTGAHCVTRSRIGGALLLGVADVLGTAQAREVEVRPLPRQDVNVYTLAGRHVAVSSLEALQAVSEYDLGLLVGSKLRALGN